VKSKTQRIVLAALFAALVCVATMVIRVPSPKGYVNLGDSFVVLAGWMLPPWYGFFAAAIGSTLADLISGFGVYAPVTFLIKGAMALSVFLFGKVLKKGMGKTTSKIIGAVVAEIIMVLGYFLFEGIFYGSFAVGALSIPFNAVQGAVGLIVGIVLAKIFEKSGIMKGMPKRD